MEMTDKKINEPQLSTEEYVHITSWENCKAGQVIETNWGESNYWKSKLDVKSYDLGESANGISNIIKTIIGSVLPEESAAATTKGLDSIFNGYKYSSELLKEYIFEDVRAKEFNHRPSRKKCLFALPSNVDSPTGRQRFGLTKEFRKNEITISPLPTAKFFTADAAY